MEPCLYFDMQKKLKYLNGISFLRMLKWQHNSQGLLIGTSHGILLLINTRSECLSVHYELISRARCSTVICNVYYQIPAFLFIVISGYCYGIRHFGNTNAITRYFCVGHILQPWSWLYIIMMKLSLNRI